MKWHAGSVAALMLAVTLQAAAAPGLASAAPAGLQAGVFTLRESATPAAPAGPAVSQKQAAAQPAGRTQAVHRPGWAGILGGLAAGLGLAWLANALGLGAGFGEFLLLALLMLAVLAAVGALLRSRRRSMPRAGGLAFESPGTPEQARSVPQYSPDKVGNDASARPWERNSMAFELSKVAPPGVPGPGAVAAPVTAPRWGIPAGFDVAGFVETAKRNFVTLQDAWDRGNVELLRSLMSDEMVREIRSQLAERQAGGAAVSRTEVVMLEARLLGIEEHPADYLASVEFSGMLREDPSAGPSPFREVWNMRKPRDGSAGWLVAGVQALRSEG